MPRAGGSSNGRTPGFGPVDRGSSPCPPALGMKDFKIIRSEGLDPRKLRFERADLSLR